MTLSFPVASTNYVSYESYCSIDNLLVITFILKVLKKTYGFYSCPIRLRAIYLYIPFYSGTLPSTSTLCASTTAFPAMT